MKQVIEQIKKMKGVKSVTAEGNVIITVFEAPKYQAVKCENEDQWEFAWGKYYNGHVAYAFNSKDGVGRIFNAFTPKNFGVQNDVYFQKYGYSILSFSDFLTQENLVGEYKDYLNNLKYLKPEQLVKGEIYYNEDGVIWSGIFRSKGENHGYSRLFTNSNQYYGLDSTICVWGGKFRHATTTEKQHLIKAEIENGFYYELEKQ